MEKSILENDLTAGNKLIAEFMGKSIYPISGEAKKWLDISDGKIKTWRGQACDFHWFEIKYHKSWDWLMPVVEKIEKDLEPISFIIHREATEWKVWDEGGFYKAKNIVPDNCSKIGHVYKAVIQVIEWHNEAKESA